MSLGPSSLGNLLVQRLDSALGVSQTAQNRTGAHPDALRQTPSTQRLAQTEQQNRSSRDAIDKTKQGRAGATTHGRQDPRVAAQLQRYTDSRFTASAPTTLGRTAQTLLALLTQHHNQPVQGQRPLLQAALQQNAHAATGSKQPPTSTAQQTRPLPSSVQAQSQPTPLPATQARAALNTALPTTAPASSTTAGTNTATQGPTASLGLQNHSPVTAAANPTSGATALVQMFTQALSQNVQQSGMFYESHLAQLMKGQTTVAQLQQQPQAQAHHQSASAPAASKSASQPQTNNAATTLQQSGIEPSTQPTVRQQLEVLANQIFSWRGEAWQGVPMEWEVRRHQEHEEEHAAASQSDPESNLWQTRLRLELPQLGEVEASLYIQDKTVRIAIKAPDSADQLKQNLKSLVQRLEAQGLGIQQLQIARHSYEDGMDEHGL